MAPEHDAPTRAFYDHESDEPAPARRRRAAADWGVNEDIFDRMPSRRFKRADRRAEHHEETAARFERRTSGPARSGSIDASPLASEWVEEETRDDDWSDAHERRQVAPLAGEWAGRRPARADRRPVRRPAESWTAGDEGNVEVEGKRPIQSWLEPERGESRTIVLERAQSEVVAAIEEPHGRRTVTITGHPDRLPAARSRRPPRTAIERIGARPDRIAGYAVLLGILLILIAVLTTGQ